MAEIKVSQLPEASEINDNDLIMIVQNNVNKKITKENCKFASGDEISIGTTQPSEEEIVWINPNTDDMKYYYNNAWQDYTPKALDSMEIGSIIAFAGDTIPTGWLVCDGSSITQSAYPELYALIGGTLPDFKGKTLVGKDSTDTDFDTLLETGGSKELQQHNHTISGGTFAIADATSISAYGSGSASGYTLGSQNATDNAGTGNSGNLQPYAVINWIIKATNTTPTMASVVNAHSTSTTDTYSCDYVNGTMLYNNSTGTTDGITLSDSVANYSRVDIFYKDDNNIYNTTTIYEPNNKTISLQVFQYDSTNSQVVLRGKNISLSTTSLSNIDYYAIAYNGSGNTLYHNNNIVITKVVGYK